MAFANAPEAARFVTSRYSFRLLTDYDPPSDRAPEAAPHIDVIAGGSDELMDAAAYQSPFHRSVYMLSYCLTLIIWGRLPICRARRDSRDGQVIGVRKANDVPA
jgi:hypothetical protein